MSLSKMYQYLYFPFAALFPPLYYFYVVKFLNPEHYTSLKEKFLFLPFMVFVVLNIIYRIGVLTDYQNDSFYAFFGLALNVIEISSSIFTILMLFFLFKMSFDYEKKNAEFDFNSIQSPISWLKMTLGTLLLVSLLWLYLVLINTSRAISFYPLWIAMSAIIYWLGYTGIYKYGVIVERKKIRAHSSKTNQTPTNKSLKNDYILGLDKLLVDQKYFLDPNLNLDIVANKLGVSSSHLSRTINSELNKGFTEYLNELRVKEAQAYLTNSEFSNYTIIAVGLEAGFNSKSSFFNVFKKVTGQTPSTYKKQYLQN